MSSYDGGLTDIKTEEEHNLEIRDLGLRFEHGCMIDKWPLSCYSWGLWYERYKLDLNRAFEIQEMNCRDNNYAQSCFKYGLMYFNGIGVNKNFKKSFEIFSENCDQRGDWKSCLGAGLMLCHGIEEDIGKASNIDQEPKNYRRAMPYLEKACENGLLQGCYKMGEIFIHNEETDKAYKYWDKACSKGLFPACLDLSIAYKYGKGVKTDQNLSKKYLQQAAENLEKYMPDVNGATPQSLNIFYKEMGIQPPTTP